MLKVSRRRTNITKLTSKGQVTIPQTVRHELSLKTGDRLVIETEKNRAYIRPLPRKSLEEIYGSLPVKGPIDFKKVREIMKEEMAEKFSKLG